jgi:hypothetical protein
MSFFSGEPSWFGVAPLACHDRVFHPIDPGTEVREAASNKTEYVIGIETRVAPAIAIFGQ